jgi:uncharacterized Zn finger protein (UPF0148 family)
MGGFDKEAERERLREKYERDQEKREATQRMSELLLKGATMTNQHCGSCGDPLFRHDGQVFCPTCGDGESDADAADEAPEGETAATESTGDAEPAAPDPSAADATPTDGTAGRPPAASPPAADGRPQADASSRRARTPDAERTRDADRSPRDAERSETASLAEARESLTRTLVRYAAAAEEADDPRRARDLLSAAREAAETLSALRAQ